MTFGNPPQRDIGSRYRIEPLPAFVNHLGVSAQERVLPKIFQIFPDRHVEEESFRIEPWEVFTKNFQMRE